MDSPIIYAHLLNAEGGSRAIKADQLQDLNAQEDCFWLHLWFEHAQTPALLAQLLPDVDQAVIHAFLQEESRPRVIKVGDGALINLRGANLNQDASPEDMVAARLWVDNKRVITLRRRKLMAIVDIDQALNAGTGPCSSGDFVATLSRNLIQRLEPSQSNLSELIDEVEEHLELSAERDMRESMVRVRQQAIMFKRYMSPQRDALKALLSSNFSWMLSEHSLMLRDSLDHLIRFIEDLETVRERAQVAKDELSNMVADRLNRNMYVLSIISAVFLPLGFLTGLLGINVGGIPGADNPYAFAIFCGLLLLTVAFQIALLIRFKWF